jgi:ribose 5-phosphate isomerase A
VERAAARLGLAGPVALRRSDAGGRFVTDGGNHILDAAFGAIPDPEALAAALDRVVGVVEHGLFMGLASVAFVAEPGGVRRLTA